MYLPIPPQRSCSAAWLAAVKAVEATRGHEAYNVIIDVARPSEHSDGDNRVTAHVDDFLRQRSKSVHTVANTIFPLSLYARHGHPKFIEVFHKSILPKVRKKQKWSGYYFERMTCFPAVGGKPIDQLSEIIERIKDPAVRALNKYELSLFDPERDVDGSPYGGQCLSYLSFKLTPGDDTKLHLTALYRNQYYVEKLLGNLIGLGRLMKFIADESKISVGALTLISTHAEVDTPDCGRKEIAALIENCGAALKAEHA